MADRPRPGDHHRPRPRPAGGHGPAGRGSGSRPGGQRPGGPRQSGPRPAGPGRAGLGPGPSNAPFAPRDRRIPDGPGGETRSRTAIGPRRQPAGRRPAVSRSKRATHPGVPAARAARAPATLAVRPAAARPAAARPSSVRPPTSGSPAPRPGLPWSPGPACRSAAVDSWPSRAGHPTVPGAGAAAAGPARPRGGARGGSPAGGGGLRRRPPGIAAARRSTAPGPAREAGAPCDAPAHPHRRIGGWFAYRAGRLRRPSGRGARRRTAPIRGARRHPGQGNRARRAATDPGARLARGSPERRNAAAKRGGGGRSWRDLPDPPPGPADAGCGQGLSRCRRASPALPRRRPRGCAGRSARSRAAHRGFRGGRVADRPAERPSRPPGHRRRQRRAGPGSGGPSPLRPVHAHPDAWGGGLAERCRRRLHPAVRGRRAA